MNLHTRSLCALLTLLLSSCSLMPGTSPRRDGSILVIGVVGLREQDPVLERLPTGARVMEDALATGCGSSAALALLDGRDAADELREPADPLAWARNQGRDTQITVLDRQLRSEPEWVHSTARYTVLDSLPARTGRGIQVILLGREQSSAAALGRLVDSALDGGSELVLLAGIPTSPPETMRTQVGWGFAQLIRRQRVPVMAWGPGASRVPTTERRVPADALAAYRGETPPSRRLRGVRWWNHHGGGLLVEDGDWIAATMDHRHTSLYEAAPDSFRDRTDRYPGRADSLLHLAEPSGRLLILLRGSTESDLVELDLLTTEAMSWQPWGLEPIDDTNEISDQHLRLFAAAEMQGDGIVLTEPQWPGAALELRIRPKLEEAPWIGTPFRLARNGQWLGQGGLLVGAWSRDAWSLGNRDGFDTGTWWRSSAPGVDLLWIDSNDTLPEPVDLEP